MLEQPGPPLNHVARGAVAGLFLDSKNQKNIFSFADGFSRFAAWSCLENLPPTDRYPENWLTPGVVSHMPELVTKSMVAPVAS
jgi:hypothetical protein